MLECFLYLFFTLYEALNIDKWIWFMFWLACHPVFFVYKYIVEVLPHQTSVFVRNFMFVGRGLKPIEVVVLGGGFVGTVVAAQLQGHKGVHVTVIDKKTYFEYIPSSVRVVVDPVHKKTIQVDYKKFLGDKAHFINATAIRVEPRHVVLQSESIISFDFLVIGTGSSYVLPDKALKMDNVILAHTADDTYHAYDKLNSARNVVVIGGGTTGVEVAAEILSEFPQKHVTIVHSGSTLLGSISKSSKASIYAESFFRSKKAEILYNNRVVGPAETGGFLTNKNHVIKGDLAYFCCCSRPNIELFENSPILRDSIQSSGYISTNQYLQLESHPHIYVAGDVSSVCGPEAKLAQNAEEQGKVIASNILRAQSALTFNRPTSPRNLIPYTSSEKIVVVSLGKYDGMICFGPWVLIGIPSALLKEAIEWKTLLRYWEWKFPTISGLVRLFFLVITWPIRVFFGAFWFLFRKREKKEVRTPVEVV